MKKSPKKSSASNFSRTIHLRFKDDNLIQLAQQLTGEKTASRAFKQAIVKLQACQSTIGSLNAELRRTTGELDNHKNMFEAFKNFKQAFEYINGDDI